VKFNYTAVLKVPESRDEKRTRDARQSPLNLIEMAAACQQFPHDQWRPAVGKNLSGAGDRTILMAFGHTPWSSNRNNRSSPKIGLGSAILKL
jgi:hypothetical protein